MTLHPSALNSQPRLPDLDSLLAISPAPPPELRRLRILWLIDLDHRSGMLHGGNLRWFNLSRELLKQGHAVYFAVNHEPSNDRAPMSTFLDRLQRESFITGYVDTHHRLPSGRSLLGPLVDFPGIGQRVFATARRGVSAQFADITERMRPDLCIFSARQMLFLLPDLAQRLPVLIDWVDSFVLYHARAARRHVRSLELGPLLVALRYLLHAWLEERYYGRRARANITVSPADKQVLERILGHPQKTRVLLNGVHTHTKPVEAKIKDQLIFTGNMNFPPNHQAAVWFIRHVLPLLRRERPGITFVVAGRNPLPELQALAAADVRILGYVDDLGGEIARSELYVAPLVSGGGFKNKIVEALSVGTFVAATPIAVEFLDEPIRRSLLVADRPGAIAQQILLFLDRPREFDETLANLQKIIRLHFTWPGRAGELLGIISEVSPELRHERT